MKTKTAEQTCPIYFLYGPEDYLIEDEIQRLLNRILSQKERGLNLHIFSGEEHRSQEILQTSQTLPMFSRYRFILVSEADLIAEEQMEVLLDYIRKPLPTTLLVFNARAMDNKQGCYERLPAQHGLLQHLSHLRFHF